MKRVFIILLLLFMGLKPFTALAQFSFDVPSVEAYINDHKKQKSLLLARATLEQSNALLHSYSRDASVEFKEINVELDRYTRAFDIIDLLYQTLRTSLNTYDTYETVHQRISDYKTMLTSYYNKCLSRVDIVTTDTLIISINYHMLENVTHQVENIYHSFTDLVLYATGAAACSSSDLLFIVTSINDSLDKIQLMLNTAYFDTWKYIQVRTGYWKAQVYRAHSIGEIAAGAFGRWQRAGRLQDD